MNDLGLDIDEIITTLEPMRARAKTTTSICVGFFLAFVLAYAFTWVPGLGGALMVFMPLVIAVAIIFFFISRKANNEYRYNFKNLIVSKVLDAFFDDPIYLPEAGFSKEEFRSAHLIRWREGFRYKVEDMVKASYKGIEFKQSDVNITHTEGSGRSRRTVIDVDGRLTRFECPKDIKSRILIVKRGTSRASLEGKLNKITLEDVEFNNKYDVFADDAHSAFYLLTPHFMNHIKNLYNADKNIYISYDGTYLYVLRSGKGGVFEPDMKKVDIGAEIRKTRNELGEIVELIDILKI